MAQYFSGVPKIGRSDTCVMFHNAAVENAMHSVCELGLGNMTLDASFNETPITDFPVRAKAVSYDIPEDSRKEAVEGITLALVM